MQYYDFLPGWRIVPTYVQIEHAIGEWPFIFLLHVSSVSQSSNDRLVHPTCVVDASHMPRLVTSEAPPARVLTVTLDRSTSHTWGCRRTTGHHLSVNDAPTLCLACASPGMVSLRAYSTECIKLLSPSYETSITHITHNKKRYFNVWVMSLWFSQIHNVFYLRLPEHVSSLLTCTRSYERPCIWHLSILCLVD